MREGRKSKGKGRRQRCSCFFCSARFPSVCCRAVGSDPRIRASYIKERQRILTCRRRVLSDQLPAHPVPGEFNYGGLGVSRRERNMVESGCSGNCTSELQTHPLVKEGAPQQETRNCQAEKKNLVLSSRWESD
jgi:hypothetical protein